MNNKDCNSDQWSALLSRYPVDPNLCAKSTSSTLLGVCSNLASHSRLPGQLAADWRHMIQRVLISNKIATIIRDCIWDCSYPGQWEQGGGDQGGWDVTVECLKISSWVSIVLRTVIYDCSLSTVSVTKKTLGASLTAAAPHGLVCLSHISLNCSSITA